MPADASKLLDDLPSLVDPAENATTGPALTIQQAKDRLAQSQKKLVRWEKLFKDGVLSKSEVERCTVEVAEALARYEHANVTELQHQLASAKDRTPGTPVDQSLITTASDALKSAETAAGKADTQLLQTKYSLAKINLDRQRKLYQLRMISLAAVQDAESLVQKFEEQKALEDEKANPAPAAPPEPPIPPIPATAAATSVPRAPALPSPTLPPPLPPPNAIPLPDPAPIASGSGAGTGTGTGASAATRSTTAAGQAAPAGAKPK